MNIKTFTLFSLLVITFIFTNPLTISANHDNSSIEFLKKSSFRDIQDIAYEEDKPIFITFHAAWSTPCKTIQTEIFQNAKVAEYMNANFVNYSANIETKIGSALSEYFDIYHLPTVLIITPKGEIIVKNANITTAKKFMKWAKEAKAEYTVSKVQEDTGSTNFKNQDMPIAPPKCLRNKSTSRIEEKENV